MDLVDFSIDSSAQTAQFYNNLRGQILKVYSSILLVVGTIGNVMSIVVLSHKNLRCYNATTYLIVLAVVDICALYMGLFRFWLIAFFHINFRYFSNASCKAALWLLYTAVYSSVWTVVALTFERLTAVFRPYHVKTYCTRRTPFVVLTIIIVVLLTINSQFLYTYTLGRIYIQEGETRVVLNICGTYQQYQWFYDKIWAWVQTYLYSLIPLVIVCVSNTAIIMKVHRGHWRARHVLPQPAANRKGSEHPEQDSRQRKLSSMTVMLLLLNSVLLVTTLPLAVMVIVEPYLTRGDNSEEKTAKIGLAVTVAVLLSYTNNGINFILYCSSGSRFREELLAMFTRKSTGLFTRSGPTINSARSRTFSQRKRTTISTVMTAFSITASTQPRDRSSSLPTRCMRVLKLPSFVSRKRHPLQKHPESMETEGDENSKNHEDKGIQNESEPEHERDLEVPASKRNENVRTDAFSEVTEDCKDNAAL